MAEDDLQAWMFIEEAAADQPQRMYRRFRCEGPGRPEQPSVTFIERRGYRRRPRVEVHIGRDGQWSAARPRMIELALILSPRRCRSLWFEDLHSAAFF